MQVFVAISCYKMQALESSEQVNVSCVSLLDYCYALFSIVPLLLLLFHCFHCCQALRCFVEEFALPSMNSEGFTILRLLWRVAGAAAVQKTEHKHKHKHRVC